MRVIRICTAALARFFISAIFLAGAVKNILNWHETEGQLMNAFCDWQTYLGFWEEAQFCFTFLTPWTPLLLVLATLFQLVGGLFVLLGVKEKLGAALLVLFLIPATVIFHSFWFLEGSARDLQSVMFLKNLAILGALFLLLLHGGHHKVNSGGGFSSLKLG